MEPLWNVEQASGCQNILSLTGKRNWQRGLWMDVRRQQNRRFWKKCVNTWILLRRNLCVLVVALQVETWPAPLCQGTLLMSLLLDRAATPHLHLLAWYQVSTRTHTHIPFPTLSVCVHAGLYDFYLFVRLHYSWQCSQGVVCVCVCFGPVLCMMCLRIIRKQPQ